jgi:hypothetical protein
MFDTLKYYTGHLNLNLADFEPAERMREAMCKVATGKPTCSSDILQKQDTKLYDYLERFNQNLNSLRTSSTSISLGEGGPKPDFQAVFNTNVKDIGTFEERTFTINMNKLTLAEKATIDATKKNNDRIGSLVCPSGLPTVSAVTMTGTHLNQFYKQVKSKNNLGDTDVDKAGAVSLCAARNNEEHALRKIRLAINDMISIQDEPNTTIQAQMYISKWPSIETTLLEANAFITYANVITSSESGYFKEVIKVIINSESESVIANMLGVGLDIIAQSAKKVGDSAEDVGVSYAEGITRMVLAFANPIFESKENMFKILFLMLVPLYVLKEAVNVLKGPATDLLKYWKDMKQLENEGDRIRGQTVIAIGDKPTQVLMRDAVLTDLRNSVQSGTTGIIGRTPKEASLLGKAANVPGAVIGGIASAAGGIVRYFWSSNDTASSSVQDAIQLPPNPPLDEGHIAEPDEIDDLLGNLPQITNGNVGPGGARKTKNVYKHKSARKSRKVRKTRK